MDEVNAETKTRKVVRDRLRHESALSSLAGRLATDPPRLKAAIERLEKASGSAKFRAAKALLQLSEVKPQALYPHFGLLLRLLHSDNQILKWTAIRIVANVASVDAKRRIERILDGYLAMIDGPVMITAANTIAGAALITKAKPQLTDRVVRAILRVERARYQTEECRNVAIGHAIKAFSSMEGEVQRRKKVVDFVKRQTRNTRPATRKKALDFLRRLRLRTRGACAAFLRR